MHILISNMLIKYGKLKLNVQFIWICFTMCLLTLYQSLVYGLSMKGQKSPHFFFKDEQKSYRFRKI